MARPRRTVVAITTGFYLANWPAMATGAFVGYSIDRSHGERMEWDGLGGLIYGSFTGLVIAHVPWAVATLRLLRQRSPRSEVVIVIVLVPTLTVATAIVLAAGRIQGGALVGWMLLASAAYPALLTWWTTGRWASEPDPSLEPGTH